jgi:PIN domain nuclease of toxin-antitoxin system
VVLALIEQNELFVSPAVLLELKYLLEIGKITVPPLTILHALGREIGLKICEEGFLKIIRAALDYSWTRDPLDRIITALAAAAKALLITKDACIRMHYKKAVWD